MHVYSGLYFKSRLVVGSRTFTARIRLSLLGESRLIPLFDKPVALSNRLSRAFEWLVIVSPVVLTASSVARMFCAAAPYVSLNALSERQSWRIVSLRGLIACSTSLASVI